VAATERPGRTDFDPSVPHPARVYNYWLGGKDNFAADRKAAEQVIRLLPEIVAGMRANREFLVRTVRYLASQGVRQFLDVGTGLPAPNNTHEVAQAVAPASRVVYVDNDPMVVVHAEALLRSSPEGRCVYVDADMRDADFILNEASQTLDFNKPVALLLLMILHLVPDDAEAERIVAALAKRLAPGSFIAISHMTADFEPEAVLAAATAYNDMAPVPVTARNHAQVNDMFGGRQLIEPGLVAVNHWPSDGSTGETEANVGVYGGVARV
jgi:O-methyltransferase involved in polyketide biosynthesis